MMASRVTRLWSIGLAAVAAAGCSASAPARFYTLESTATAVDAPPARSIIEVGPVSIPAAVDRSQFVVQVAPHRVEIDEFNLWAAPLNDGVARAVSGNLIVLLGTPDVATGPLANFNPTYLVTIDVQRFDSELGKAVLMEAVWTVRETATRETQAGRTVAREPVQGSSSEALAAGHSRALATMSGDIVAAIRTAAARAETKPPVARKRPVKR